MDISLYLARMPEEAPSKNDALLLCPFAPGFSLPPVPEGGILIFTDSTPYIGQPPEEIFGGKEALFAHISFLIADFQRQDYRLSSWIAALRRLLPCPVAAPPGYSEDGPVFLPPIPPDELPQGAIQKWQGREIILDLSPQPTRLTLTKSGCQRRAAAIPTGEFFEDETLLCAYRVTKQSADAVEFTLWREKRQLLEMARNLGISKCVALRQEWEPLP